MHCVCEADSSNHCWLGSLDAALIFCKLERVCTAGLQQRGRQEPSFARPSPSFGSRGAQGGDFIVRGADGRGGRATVLKPHNRQPASAQVLLLLYTMSFSLSTAFRS